MPQLGLKLWSINENYLTEALKLYQQKVYDYIELYAVPGSYAQYGKRWKELAIPYIIHAPHFKDGLNLAKSGNFEKNIMLFKEAQRFADLLGADSIILHPGIAGDTKETIRQLKKIGDKRILIENKPYLALTNDLLCNASSPAEIEDIIKQTGYGFCLDIGHAICAANATKRDPLEYLNEFLKLKPKMFHFTDGDFSGVYDRHDHYGRGTFPIEKILSIISKDSPVTIETIKDSQESLADFVADVNFIKKIIVK